MAMTPTDAAATLRSIEGYAQTLTSRTIGMTNMVWAVAAAGIFLTYGTAARLLDGTGHEWAYALLWIPGVLGGTILTWSLWHSHAVTLRLDLGPGHGATHMALHVLGFLVLAGALFYGLHLGGVAWSTHTIMVLANGLFAIALGVNLRRESRVCAQGSILAGIAMVAAGTAIGLLGPSEAASALAGAATVFIAWATTGIVSYLKG